MTATIEEIDLDADRKEVKIKMEVDIELDASDYDPEILGSRLRQMRNRERLTQTDVANRLDPPPTIALISSWELGRSRISGHYFVQLQQIFPELLAVDLSDPANLDRVELMRLIERQKLENDQLKSRLTTARKALTEPEVVYSKE